MASSECAVATQCLARLKSKTSAAEFGYKVQALAAHVLLALNHEVVEVNQRGHPDVVSVKDGEVFGFEIEAEVVGGAKRRPTSSDFDALMATDLRGYFALAVSFPRPYWVVVPAWRLMRRRLPAGNVLLEALSDKGFSSNWTREYLSMISRSCEQVSDRSFEQLVRRAITGRHL